MARCCHPRNYSKPVNFAMQSTGAFAVSVWDISAPLAEVIYLIRGTLRISPFWVLPTHSPVPLLLTIYTQVGCIPIQGLIAIPSDSAVGKSND